MVNFVFFVAYRNIAVIVAPNIGVDSGVTLIISISIFVIGDAVEALMSIIDLFGDGRAGEVAFKHVNAVAFKVVGSGVAQDFKRRLNFLIENHK